jgi:hypothetical protein
MSKLSFVRAAAVAALSFVAACGDATTPTMPAAPAAPAAAAPVFSTGTGEYIGFAAALARTTPLNKTYTATARIGAKGGQIRINEAGLTITFPEGAVRGQERITVTAHAGNYVVYSFQPHGLIFREPVKVTQDLRETAANKDMALAERLLGAYLPDDLSDLDLSTGQAKVAEKFMVSIDPEMNKVNPRWARFHINHFSGYILASGFAESAESLFGF